MTSISGHRKRRLEVNAYIEKRTKCLVTPEGVSLNFLIAAAGDRFTAYLIDATIICLLFLLCWLIAWASQISEISGLMLVAFFLIRNFYFMVFEQRWRGVTPGKRIKGLRVVDAYGGQLTVEAVIVRNLTRDLEIFIPTIVIIYAASGESEFPVPVLIGSFIWLLAMAFMPLFNRQRCRVGDLIAGTMVIESPQVSLLEDLAEKPAAEEEQPQLYRFTVEQLAHYGVYELQVLEDVLRHVEAGNKSQDLLAIVERIQVKIDWSTPEILSAEQARPVNFLKAFYKAQRVHLESRLLMGVRREDKFSETPD